MPIVAFNASEKLYKALKSLVEKGVFSSMSEAVRTAVRHMVSQMLNKPSMRSAAQRAVLQYIALKARATKGHIVSVKSAEVNEALCGRAEAHPRISYIFRKLGGTRRNTHYIFEKENVIVFADICDDSCMARARAVLCA